MIRRVFMVSTDTIGHFPFRPQRLHFAVMPSASDFPARGKVLRVENGAVVVFQPANTTYELHLALAKGAELPAPSGRSVSATIRCTARKVMTMPSGGNFITPIFGPPRVIQGMVRYLDERVA